MKALMASLGDGVTPAYVAHAEIEAALFKIYDLADVSYGRAQALVGPYVLCRQCSGKDSGPYEFIFPES